jgi:hypothetical protein
MKSMTAPTKPSVVAAMLEAVETIRYIDHSGMVPGSADETADVLEKAAADAQQFLMTAVLAARMMKANGLADVADYAMLRDQINQFDPNYCAKIGVTL